MTFARETRSDAHTSFSTGFEVSTDQRLSGVAVAVSAVTVSEYDFVYATGDNGTRSLLQSVTETGYAEDGTPSTLPATTFEYSVSGTEEWVENTSATVPLRFLDNQGWDQGLRILDVNGDALPDLVQSLDSGSGTLTQKVYINQGNNAWSLVSGYSIPGDFVGSSHEDKGYRFMEVNGDGYPDLVRARENGSGTLLQGVYINDGDGTGWTQDTGYTVPRAFVDKNEYDTGVQFGDINGDGFDDMVESRNWNTGVRKKVYINDADGTGWTQDTGYTVPTYFVETNHVFQGAWLIDVNADGLADIVKSIKTSCSNPATRTIYINDGDGTGWTQDAGYTIPLDFVNCSNQDTGVRLIDVNGDGYMDFVQSRENNSSPGTYWKGAYVNDGDGTGWAQDTGYTIPTHFITAIEQDRGVRVADADGDGREDLVYSRKWNSGAIDTDAVYIRSGDIPDFLVGVTTSKGAEIGVSYAPSSGLPFVLQTLSEMTVDDGLGNVSTTSYAYGDGHYYYADEDDRRFAGFATSTSTDDEGNQTVQYFHQGNGTESSLGESTDAREKIGRMYREERYDAVGHLYKTTIHSWDSADLGYGDAFVYESQTLELLYDEDNDHRDKASSFSYDSTSGNLSERIEQGEVTGSGNGTFTDVTSSDDVTTEYAYAAWSSGSDSAYPSEETVSDGSSAQVRDTRWYYDGQSFGSVTAGNRTRESRWIEGTTYADTDYTYDVYGLVSSVEDPLGNETTYAADTAHLYPASETDALTNVTSYEYDYASGKVSEVTDKNGFVFQTEYDGIGRPIAERQPDPNAPTTLVLKTEWEYSDASVPATVHRTDYFDGTVERETYTYVDGLGRPIQERKEIGGTGTYAATDTAYDQLGRVESVTLPYESSGSARTSPTTNGSLFETFAYDALGRVTSATNADGAATKGYEDWEVTETDRAGNEKAYAYDAYGRLVAVAEHDGASAYTTEYGYDAVGNLATFTDSAGNVRTFAYDGLGRRTEAEDLHDVGDSKYGIWTYAFDIAGNLTSSVSPNGITTTYVYDDLNRVTSEDASSTGATDVTYAYDTCDNGVGRVCSVAVDGGATTAYAYDALGKVGEETKTISSTAYVTAYAYDRQGNLSALTYPDGSETAYALDNAGQVDSVTFTDAVAGGSGTLASNIAYAPTGNVTNITFDNGVETTYEYDMNHLYRLTNLTTVSGSTTLQDFAYTYDSAGNLSALTDDSSLYASVDITYNYDDLYRLTGATATSTDSALAYAKTWTYDSLGNILTSGAGSYAYDGTASGSYANPHAVTGIGSVAYAYDENGNMTSDGTWANAWDYRNRLAASDDGVTAVSYAYDHEGNRVAKTDSAETTVYPNGYYSVEGNEVKRHVDVAGFGSIATSSYDTAIPTAETAYHHRDHLGGTHVDTDSSGSSLEYVLYEPFGRSLADWKSGGYENNRKFTGKELDLDTGWHYYGSRYYASEEGRFLSEDPVFLSAGAASDKSAQERLLADPQLWNSYAYSRNNPVLLTDSSGQFLDVLLDVAFAAYDLAALAYDEITTGGQNRTMNVAALSADAAFALVPGLTGGGIAVRVGAHADEAVDAARVIQNAPKVKLGVQGGEGAGKRFSERIKDMARGESSNKCVFCGQQTTDVQGPLRSNIDHSVPRSRGGNNGIDNAQNSCRTCNLQKGDRTSNEFLDDLASGETLKSLIGGK